MIVGKRDPPEFAGRSITWRQVHVDVATRVAEHLVIEVVRREAASKRIADRPRCLPHLIPLGFSQGKEVLLMPSQRDDAFPEVVLVSSGENPPAGEGS